MAQWQSKTRRDTIFESERSGIQDLEPSISWRNWLKETKTSGSREIVKTLLNIQNKCENICKLSFPIECALVAG